LSNLAYAKYEKVDSKGGNELSNYKIKSVEIDVLSVDIGKFKESDD
jgi:hypothetical protein